MPVWAGYIDLKPVIKRFHFSSKILQFGRPAPCRERGAFEVNMTKYEQIQTRIENCEKAAGRTEGSMRDCWLEKMEALKTKRDNMTLEEAGQPI